MILVTGATGQLGKAVVNQLLVKTAASNIAVFARDAEKAKEFAINGIDVRIGDFDNRDSLSKAMKGIEKVLLISGGDPVNRLQQHKNVIDAAKNANVKRIAYTGAIVNDLTTSANQFLMQSHFQTEDYITGSGLTYTFFRNTLYTDTILMFVAKQQLDMSIALPTGEGKVGFALRREIGEAIANGLLENSSENKLYQLTGSHVFSYKDVAAELASLTDRNISYAEIGIDAYGEVLKKMGVPEMLITTATAFALDIRNNQHNKVTQDLEKLLGRKPLDFSRSLKDLYDL